MIALICLNLPANLRYKWKNMFLFRIIPGPREPSMEETDHYLVPLMNSFVELWDPGVYLTRTAKYPMGRVIRCALVPFATDMKASRKLAGSQQCGLCNIERDKLRAGTLLDPKEFPRKMNEEYRAKATLWQNAVTLASRDTFYREKGIHWTPFLLLPYWNPTRLTAVDVMHALLEGVV
ncbi:hypothetical protein M422DRAFT_167540 [Sphaerobolus stellatus SS14]|uniref:Unplaced genomic scaffold SPHSTscaffold_39, whole genome shotgun sequence n=1 Tax=Sphaerobolus stellatus (strain SS14) TaxID=990650 RepID=A0A0C9VD30_SPHS4|nr:hypothetical protein M422DRAFT_167540 [Sphaerobolus stellatus SS14]